MGRGLVDAALLSAVALAPSILNAALGTFLVVTVIREDSAVEAHWLG